MNRRWDEPFAWTDERKARLKELHAGGHSMTVIGGMLGCSRNAVVGKIHRMGLAPGGRRTVEDVTKVVARQAAKTIRSRQKNRFPRPTMHSKPLPKPSEPPVEWAPLMIPLEALTDAVCKWPIGDAHPFGFCGHRSWNSLPYCEYHSRVAYQPVDRRAERQRNWVVNGAAALR